MNKNKNFTINIVFRGILIIFAIAPFLFWRVFYEHFYAYLTGTIINMVIKQEWQLVLFFIILFMLFAIPLTYRKRAKWIDYGLVGAFFVSLFIEMYGIPLTILFASKYFFAPGMELPPNLLEFSFLGVGIGMDHAMVYGSALMIIGMGLILAGWFSLYQQARRPGFARTGIYSISRHPQYLGFILLVMGWFFGWPTILTLVFSPILVYKYIKAARREEKDMMNNYGDDYISYIDKTPFFI